MKRKSIAAVDGIQSDQVPPEIVEGYCPREFADVNTEHGVYCRVHRIGELAPTHRRPILVRGFANYYGGYAEHTRAVLEGLHATAQYAPKLSTIPSPIDVDPLLSQRLGWFERNPMWIRDGSPTLTIAGPGYMQKQHHIGTGPQIGWTMIETLRAQKRVIEWCKDPDMLLLPTEVDMGRFGGIHNIELCPLGYDPEIYHPNVRPMNIREIEGRFVFGYVGSWNARKGIHDIVKAYVQEFSHHDPVTLLLFSKYATRKHGPSKEDDTQWSMEYELQQCLRECGYDDYSAAPHIAIIDVPVHPVAVAPIMANFNALVGFSAGESTWLPGLHAGAMNIPIIQLASKCSGFMDYLGGSELLCRDVKYVEATENNALGAGTSEYYIGERLAVGNVKELQGKMRILYSQTHSVEHSRRVSNSVQQVAKNVAPRTWLTSTRVLSSLMARFY